MNSVGVVVIGRNEGERLQRCLQSIVPQVEAIVYVDSDSTDNSVAYALSLGLEVVSLDMHLPFSAARARNEGFARLLTLYPELCHVQFVDGDCEVAADWLAGGCEFLEKNTGYAIVAGRLRERYPEKSLYNRLCDFEWNTVPGETLACGGIFMIRVNAFQQVNGFNPQVIAGEEPELCYRLRRQGWRIYRLDAVMAIHDAAMTRFSQWWQRSVRSGYAYALGCYLHGREKEHFRLRQCLRIWLWGGLIPMVAGFGGWLGSPWLWLVLLAYPLQAARNFRNSRKMIPEVPLAAVRAIFLVIDKFPQLQGQFMFLYQTFSGRSAKIIEYK